MWTIDLDKNEVTHANGLRIWRSSEYSTSGQWFFENSKDKNLVKEGVREFYSAAGRKSIKDFQSRFSLSLEMVVSLINRRITEKYTNIALNTKNTQFDDLAHEIINEERPRALTLKELNTYISNDNCLCPPWVASVLREAVRFYVVKKDEK